MHHYNTLYNYNLLYDYLYLVFDTLNGMWTKRVTYNFNKRFGKFITAKRETEVVSSRAHNLIKSLTRNTAVKCILGVLTCTSTINLIHLYFIIISRAQYRRLTIPVVKLARIAHGTGFTCWNKLARKSPYNAIRLRVNDTYRRSFFLDHIFCARASSFVISFTFFFHSILMLR